MLSRGVADEDVSIDVGMVATWLGDAVRRYDQERLAGTGSRATAA